ncbi:heme-dependent oxidative N-demethylase family protein [Arenibacterium sp. CAU 1754]
MQRSLPYDPFAPRPLPGVAPLAMEDWLVRDEAFSGQMALRDQLLSTRRPEVLALDEGARAAAEELLDLVLSLSQPKTGRVVERADGIRVTIDHTDPMGTLGRLVQEDLCILQRHGDEHVLTGAVLCFPASWTLAEKFMRPLLGIHQPVESYDANIARRVQRLFDGVRPGRPIWRFNAFWYDAPDLYHPRRETDPRQHVASETGSFLRSERQVILRLPETQAVVFSIHTYVLSHSDACATRTQIPAK